MLLTAGCREGEQGDYGHRQKHDPFLAGEDTQPVAKDRFIIRMLAQVLSFR